MEFIYWRHPTPAGIKVEEVCGMRSKSGRVWEQMALQIYCENGRDGYRELGHFPNGAPFLFSEDCRISVTHTLGLLAVATLPRTPEADLSTFNPRTAMGIDAEDLSRAQVLKLRDRFLSDEEKSLVGAEDLAANIVAWTAKEALYKAALTEGPSLKDNFRIVTMPQIDRDMNATGSPVFGKAMMFLPSPDGTVREYEMTLYTYLSEGDGEGNEYAVTLAFSPKCAKFAKSART